uniref:30S ribosomal protein S21, chloroplastic n=1 Tax=Lotus japonicus TaxID=34305 RepID=I3T6B8_LOTJA|nr:unknown [Lotus japonicus]
MRNLLVEGILNRNRSILVKCIALTYSTTLYFKSTYNVKITVHDDEPEDKLINRFRREVRKAGVIQEYRRRMYFENKRDKIKRKAREASRRNRKRKPWTKFPEDNKDESGKKGEFDDEDDNWDLPDVDIPYC